VLPCHQLDVEVLREHPVPGAAAREQETRQTMGAQGVLLSLSDVANPVPTAANE
jgi:hypothetical protein